MDNDVALTFKVKCQGKLNVTIVFKVKGQGHISIKFSYLTPTGPRELISLCTPTKSNVETK